MENNKFITLGFIHFDQASQFQDHCTTKWIIHLQHTIVGELFSDFNEVILKALRVRTVLHWVLHWHKRKQFLIRNIWTYRFGLQSANTMWNTQWSRLLRYPVNSPLPKVCLTFHNKLFTFFTRKFLLYT